MLTFGVSHPPTNGTMMPIHEPSPYRMALMVPAKFGDKSMALTNVHDVCRPCAPMAIVKNSPTNNVWQPAYDAATSEMPSIRQAVIPEIINDDEKYQISNSPIIMNKIRVRVMLKQPLSIIQSLMLPQIIDVTM